MQRISLPLAQALALLSVLCLSCTGAHQAAAPTIAVEDGSSALGYRQVMAATTVDGRKLAEDGRAVAMVAFASWCGYCRQELAELAVLREEFPEVRIIGLNAHENYKSFSDRDRLRDFLDTQAPWLTDIVHTDARMRAAFGGIPKIPSLYVFGPRGQVIAEFRRDRRPAPSREELRQALTEAQALAQIP